MYCHSCGAQLISEAAFCAQCGTKTTQPSPSASQSSPAISQPGNFDDYKTIRRKNVKTGILWLVGPIVGLVGVMTLYAIVTFVMTASGEVDTTTAGVIQALMGLAGILCVLLIIAGVPIGLIYLAKRIPPTGEYDRRSGNGSASVVPAEIQGWNWGAAGLTLIWGVSHNVWISLLSFVPIVNMFFWIWLGVKGNELAWRYERWESIDAFKAHQQKWAPWGIAMLVIGGGIWVLSSVINAVAQY